MIFSLIDEVQVGFELKLLFRRLFLLALIGLHSHIFGSNVTPIAGTVQLLKVANYYICNPYFDELDRGLCVSYPRFVLACKVLFKTIWAESIVFLPNELAKLIVKLGCCSDPYFPEKSSQEQCVWSRFQVR